MLPGRERQHVCLEWNETRADYLADRCLHQAVINQTERRPHVVALVHSVGQLTYLELNGRSNQLAAYLQKHGVGPEVSVGIYLHPSWEMVVGILAVLKAGGACVPLDPDYPPDRVAHILTDTQLGVLLTQRRLRCHLPANNAEVFCFDAEWSRVEQESRNPIPSQCEPSNLAYVIYTSGSTGKPKGVQITHGNLVHSMHARSLYYGEHVGRFLLLSSFAFDSSLVGIFATLCQGGTLVLTPGSLQSNLPRLTELVAQHRISHLLCVPSLYGLLLEQAKPEELASLQVAIVAGESCPAELVERHYELLPHAALFNEYGPTEGTIWSTVFKCEQGQRGKLVPIGRPVPNTPVYVLDPRLNPSPVGVPGELYIGGKGVARGYLKRPELTAEKFIADPFSQYPEARLYKTGDLARYLPNGDIEFLGRIDDQVKLRGFRIELGEIEAVLRQHRDVNETVVVAREDIPGDKRLVAYFVPARKPAPTIIDLRNFLKEKLPEYMVPSVFVTLSAMPLTPNGKVDRRALPAPDQADLASPGTFAAPNGVIESRLVEIWETVLGVRPIGVRHNFFELGGHSLAAVRLMHRIEQAFGKNLPIAILLQAPTIEQLAAILPQTESSPSLSCLVPIQTGGSKLPFFCVHGLNGTVVRFRDLARHLGSDQPFYGLQAYGLDARHSAHTQAEDMASHYIKEIRSVQPEGPYFIGGYSFGGALAFEMAQQLAAQWQEDAVVVLFDTIPTQWTSISRKSASILSALLTLFRVPASERWAYLSRIAMVPIRAIERWQHVATLPRDIKKVRKACLQAERQYMPRPYAGRVILFRSSHKPLGQLSDPRAGWNTYAVRGLEIHEVLGNHENILLEPQVRFVAEHLKTCLDDARVARQIHSQRHSN